MIVVKIAEHATILVPVAWCSFAHTMNCYVHVSVNKRIDGIMSFTIKSLELF